MFASFRRLGQRDLKRLAKELHALLNAGVSTDLAGCREMVARLHGHASWAAAQGTERVPQWKRARPEVLGEYWSRPWPQPQKWPHRLFTLTPEEVTWPRLVLGATGSGRSEVLISMFKTAVDNGQSGLFLDAKGSSQLQMKVLSYAQDAGRLADVRIINLLGPQEEGVPSSPWWQPPTSHVRPLSETDTHTFNPFEQATLNELRAWWMPMWHEALTSLPEKDQAEAQAFLDNLMEVLVQGRDLGLWPLDVHVMDQALENWEPLMHDTRLDLLTRRRLEKWRGRFILWHADQAALAHARGVLQPLLSYTAFRATVAQEQGETRWASADLDWEDMIRNRRLVLIMAPALERMPLHRQVVVDWLTRSLEAAFDRVLRAPGPLPEQGGLWIFDEVGYYLNEACLNIACRARRLNTTVVSGATDWPSIKRRAPPQVYNRFAEQAGVKVFMRHHDITGMEEQWPSLFPHVKDLREQGPGEAHVFIGKRMERLRMSYYPAQSLKNMELSKPSPRWTRALLKVSP